MHNSSVVHVSVCGHQTRHDVILRAVPVGYLYTGITHVRYDPYMSHSLKEKEIARNCGIRPASHLLHFSPGIGCKTVILCHIGIRRPYSGILPV